MDSTTAVVLRATCSSCSHIWCPYGQGRTYTPLRATIKCPKCHTKMTYEWSDPETKKLIHQRKLGLDNKVDFDSLKQRIDILEQRVSLSEQQRAILEEKLNMVERWSSQREEDFRIIEEIAKDLIDDKKYREDNR